jgi:hypothetical protein
MGVEVSRRGCVSTWPSSSAVGVQVGGSTTDVGVELGRNSVGKGVAGGNGFSGVFGFEIIKPAISATIITPRTKMIDNKSQIEVFMSILVVSKY